MTQLVFSRKIEIEGTLFATFFIKLSYKIGEAFCEGLKRMCKLLEITGQKDF